MKMQKNNMLMLSVLLTCIFFIFISCATPIARRAKTWENETAQIIIERNDSVRGTVFVELNGRRIGNIRNAGTHYFIFNVEPVDTYRLRVTHSTQGQNQPTFTVRSNEISFTINNDSRRHYFRTGLPNNITRETIIPLIYLPREESKTERETVVPIVTERIEPTPVITIIFQPRAVPATLQAGIINLIEGSIDSNLTVAAIVTHGARLSYQWFSNTENSNIGETAIAGATGAEFPIPRNLTAGTYYYFCEIRATGGAVSIRSNVATVVVGSILDRDINAATGVERAILMACRTLINTLPENARIVVLNIAGRDVRLSNFTLDELESRLVGARNFTVIARNTLQEISAERSFTVAGESIQLAGEISDAAAVSIGQTLRADIVITGSFSETGSIQRLSLRAIEVSSARLLTVARETF